MLSKTSAYTASRPHPTQIINTTSRALPNNGDGVKDTPKMNSAPLANYGKVGTIINTKA
jgi:hypothetical protein